MKFYEEPEIEISALGAQDVITTSGDTGFDDSEW